MTIIEILQASQELGEGLTVEFKERLPKKDKDICKEIAAMATMSGGHIFIGVDDDTNLVGLPKEYFGYVSKIENWVSDLIKPVPVIDCCWFKFSGKNLIYIYVKPGTHPVYYYDGRPFVRISSKSQLAKPEEVGRLFLSYVSKDDIADLKKMASITPANSAISVVGAGEFVFMRYDELLERLKNDFPILEQK
ncbi:ATP-binding protein [uncultured Sphingomonas sp.]|uniref:AlbA family DNA-binding domain-containing protein n=1 Tax=uncultured Sphingomonas sp. TaxID=158754 RepID=UPI0025D41648|nr:ATP-binding protein [uncultured Sphingomonas sp.]